MRSLYYTMSEAYLAVISDNISRHFPVITYIKFPFGSQWSLSDSLFSISWVWGGSRCPWCWIAGCVVWRGDYLKPYWLTDWLTHIKARCGSGNSSLLRAWSISLPILLCQDRYLSDRELFAIACCSNPQEEEKKANSCNLLPLSLAPSLFLLGHHALSN